MTTTRFSASLVRTLPVFAVMLAGFAATAFLVAANWDNWLLSGALILPALLLALASAILAYRLIARPVMLEVNPEGIFIKRLGVTLPWDAIAAIEPFDWRGQALFRLVPAEPPHPVLTERTVLLGAALNARLGLPELVVQMPETSGTALDFVQAVRLAGYGSILAENGQAGALRREDRT